jgi:hypothetical protein
MYPHSTTANLSGSERTGIELESNKKRTFRPYAKRLQDVKRRTKLPRPKEGKEKKSISDM